MRILTVGNMYPPHHLGGYELVWRGAVDHLRSAGHQVEVLTTGFRRADVSAGDDPGVRRELSWWWRDGTWPRVSARARLAVERHNRDVLAAAVHRLDPEVVGWWSMGGMSLSLIEQTRRAGIPAVGFVHDDWLVYGPHVDAWLRLTRWARRGPAGSVVRRATGIPTRVDYSRAASWAFVSEHTRRRALRDLPLERTSVLPSGIDPTFLDPQPPRPWSWRLLYVGRVDSRKGIDVAVASLAHLPEAAELVVAGSGDLSLLAGAPGRVTSLGALDTEGLRAAYAAADVVLFPVTWHEPWGLVPLEAMGMGRPVVATIQGGSAEYLEAQVNCVECAPGDPASLAAAVRRLADSPELRAKLRDGGMATAAAHTAAGFNRGVEELLSAQGLTASRAL